MTILLIASYYYPETIGSGVWIRQLALDLKALGHHVTVLTTFPSYPHGRIFPDYRNRIYQRENIDGMDVLRAFTYATPSKRFWPRIFSFGSFCVSSILVGLFAAPRTDVVYAILPPLPLGVSSWLLAKAAGARLVVNVQDIYPDIAVALGMLRNRAAITFFERMERWLYRRAQHIVVISKGFKRNLRAKGVASGKIAVVPNWADHDLIAPSAGENQFRRDHCVDGNFLVVYSGGLTHNSHLDPVLEAAERLTGAPFQFLVIGEGVRKESLMRKANEKGLRNVRFLPFQPLPRYAESLTAADATLVTLHSAATFASVPSKIYKQMAAARPIIAIADRRSEVARLIEDSGCGICVGPEDVDGIVAALRRLAAQREKAAQMGLAGRDYVTTVCARSRCVAAIEQALAGVVG